MCTAKSATFEFAVTFVIWSNFYEAYMNKVSSKHTPPKKKINMLELKLEDAKCLHGSKQFPTTFAQGGCGVKSVSRGDCE
jgi:hypothetical protein